MPKTPKGCVAVNVFKSRLRLSWTYNGKRYYLYIGLPDGKINRVVAQQKARLIEGDMATGNFDSTLAKYKSEVAAAATGIVRLFESFCKVRANDVRDRSMEKYRHTLKDLSEYFGEKPTTYVNSEAAEEFKRWMLKRISAITVKERLFLVKACWEWAIGRKQIQPPNPWAETIKRIKVPPKQMAKPFSKDEIAAITTTIRQTKPHYGDYVEFLFGTGCRTSEAIGLRWRHINDDCSSVWIGESFCRGERKPTKTNKARTVTLTPRLKAILSNRVRGKPDALVFTSHLGDAVSDRYFRAHVWKPALAKACIEYRKPYNTRHTLISHALESGMSPVSVAYLTGNSPAIIYRHYAGVVASRPLLPELYET